MTTLSKSKLLKGFQCPKALYLSEFHPELEEEASESTERRFSDGTKVGELARERFPGGVLVEADYHDYATYLERTSAAMKSKAPAIFEAAFSWKNFFFRADVLKRAPKGAWDLVEVKMTASVKEVHLIDLAIQRIVLEGCGETVRKTFLMHLNSDCVYPNLDDLFVQVDVTKEVEEIEDKVRKNMQLLADMVKGKKTPKDDIGPHCTDPYDCAFRAHCWKHVPEPSIFDIPNLRAWKYYETGVVKLKDLAKEEIKDKVRRYLDCHLKGERHVNAKGIQAELKKWKWPLVLLDFETIARTIPELEGTSPFEQVPFQLACSVWEDPKSKKVEEFDFLDVDSADPREALARHLAEKLPKKGSVVAYHASFEGGVLKKLAEEFPKWKKELNSIRERLVDPLPVIRANVYDPGFGSTFSLKAVGPALLGKAASYEGLLVADGGGAQLAYLKLRDPATPAPEKKKLKEALVFYCRKDAETMRQLVEWMWKQA